jgi:hypothetical protein
MEEVNDFVATAFNICINREGSGSKIRMTIGTEKSFLIRGLH